MKFAAFAIAAAALAASLSQASADSHSPAAALVPAAEAIRVQAVVPQLIEGRQATVVLSDAEGLIIARNVVRH